MFAYSARKKQTKPMPEYSTWNPATISDSPSATSNGARFVSATPEMKYTTKSGKSHFQFHVNSPPDCWRTISPRFRLPAAMSTPTSAKPIAISYATIWAAERIAPRNAYFEFDAQPAMMTAYTLTDVRDSRNSSPASISAMTRFGDSGTIAQVANAGMTAMAGAMRNRKRFALAGTMISFNSSFTTSANG